LSAIPPAFFMIPSVPWVGKMQDGFCKRKFPKRRSLSRTQELIALAKPGAE
jgi:hypothetical protein